MYIKYMDVNFARQEWYNNVQNEVLKKMNNLYQNHNAGLLHVDGTLNNQDHIKESYDN